MFDSSSLCFEPFKSCVVMTDQLFLDIYSFFMDPPLKKLLPDAPPPPPGYIMPKTLVLDLKGTLVHTSYVLGHGHEVMKRPGLD